MLCSFLLAPGLLIAGYALTGAVSLILLASRIHGVGWWNTAGAGLCVLLSLILARRGVELFLHLPARDIEYALMLVLAVLGLTAAGQAPEQDLAGLGDGGVAGRGFLAPEPGDRDLMAVGGLEAIAGQDARDLLVLEHGFRAFSQGDLEIHLNDLAQEVGFEGVLFRQL